MKKLLVYFSLISLSASGQIDIMTTLLSLNISSSSASTWYPTNIGTPLSWYVVDDSQTNANGSITNISDRWANGYHLTNKTYATSPLISNAFLGGHAIAKFTASSNTFLASDSFTNSQPVEYWMVCKQYSPTNASTWLYLDSGDSTYRQYFGSRDGGLDVAAAGAKITGSATPTGEWRVVTIVFTGSSSRILTNNVVEVASNGGTKTQSGLVIGNSYGRAESSDILVAEVLAYAATNSIANQSNLFWYFTNKYGSM